MRNKSILSLFLALNITVGAFAQKAVKTIDKLNNRKQYVQAINAYDLALKKDPNNLKNYFSSFY